MSEQQTKKPVKGYILAIDNGTQSIRALLFDVNGQLVAKSKVELVAYYSDKPGWAEQDANYFWQKLGQVCQQLWAQDGVEPEQVMAVTLTTQRDTVVNVNKQGSPLRPAIIWLDQRLSENNKPMSWYWRLAFTVVRQAGAVNYFRRKAKSNWLKQHQPDIWENTHKFLLLSGFLTHKLTGEFKDSVAATVSYLPFSYRALGWSNKFDWKWQAIPVTQDMLPDLVEPGGVLGHINEQAHKATGIPVGLKLFAAASDKACEVLGSGCITPNVASLSYGTTATVNTNNVKYVEPLPFIPPFPSAIPKQYNSEVMIYRGFWMVSWFKHQFGQREMQQAKTLGVTPESLFDELVEQVPPGSMGLMLQPYWSPGLQNLEAKGAILGFGDVHTRAHIYRAILEGLAYALREGKEKLEKRQKVKIERLMVSGGGSQSDAAMQLTADIFNLPASRPHTFETSGLGAAINAAVGLGVYQDYDEACAKMTSTKDTFKPNPDNVALYQQLYSQVYLKMYRQLKPIYQTIKRITGYPK